MKSVDLSRKYDAEVPSRAQQLLEIFGHNSYYAMAKETKGEISYHPVKSPLTPEIVQSHLDGQICIGCYALEENNKVRWIAWDVDSGDREIAREYTTKICSRLRDIPHCVEFSGSKGYHVFIFLKESIPADKAKAIAEHVRDAEGLQASGNSHVECYPKQGRLTPQNPMGSLIKLPLGQHPRTHNQSIFVDIENGWENGKACDAEICLSQRIAPEELDLLLEAEGSPKEQIVELLVKQWNTLSHEHHNLALFLAGHLATSRWGLQDSLDLMEQICRKSGDDETNNRLQAVRDTFLAHEQGKPVRGLAGLGGLLPGSVLNRIVELTSRIVAPEILLRVDSLRLGRGTMWEKVRSASMIIWSDLHEDGEVVRTEWDEMYWYNRQEHVLIPFDTLQWNAMLYNHYGINPKESFGVQVSKALELRAKEDARIVKVRNRTVWDGEALYVSLGQAEVYRLDGSNIETTYNGECGYLFRTQDNSPIPVVPDWGHPTDAWKMLVEDISFNKSPDAPAKPDEQMELLKAWILSFFFLELMPTKPLLLALGMPGSGKTSAMRRLLRVLESRTAEVLEVAVDKQDSLRTSIASHRMLVLDNLEKSGAPWLVDTLNRIATGSVIEIRQLYSTNAVFQIRPDVCIAMTAVNMPFSEETLFSRLLPLELSQIESPLPEHLLQKNIDEHLNGLWADMLLKLNQIVLSLRNNQTTMPPVSSRLADFAVFCKRIEKSGVVKGAKLMTGLRSLVDRQKMALMDASPFIAVLDEWLLASPEEAAKPHSFLDMFTILEPMARARHLRWNWTDPKALARHVMTLSEPLKKIYQAKIVTKQEGNRETLVIQFPSITG